MLIAFTLVAHVALTTPQDAAGRIQEMLRGFDDDLAGISMLIDDGMLADTENPQTGMITLSATEQGSDGLHALSVIDVFPAEPADEAGIKAGDRIVAIGPRRIEHEPNAVIQSLIEGAAGPVAITVRRSGTEHIAIISRRPLRCTARAVQAFDRAKWHREVTETHELIAALRAMTELQSDNPSALQSVVNKIPNLQSRILQLIKLITGDFQATVLQQCSSLHE